MGYRQLIFLVAATIGVCTTVVVGIETFTESSVKSNYDVLIQDAMRIADDAQAWKEKPEVFGGQDDAYKALSDNFAGASLVKLGYAPNDGTRYGCYSNANGVYKVSRHEGGIEVRGWNAGYGNLVVLHVSGPSDADIELASESARGTERASLPNCEGAVYSAESAFKASIKAPSERYSSEG